MFSLKAYAKINLGLEILFKRTDGYHAINSFIHRISLYDELFFEENGAIRVQCDALSAEPEEQNLAYKAARILQQECSVAEGAKITIHKHIPIGAGLGGGSSDAATALFGLLKLWKLPIDVALVESIASQLGSDVPFFLHHGGCVASGTGTILSPCPVQLPWSIVLLCPPIHISTYEAYQGLQLNGEVRQAHDLCKAALLATQDAGILQREFCNHFENHLFTQYPLLLQLKVRLLEAGAIYAQMSGSGSSMFGLFENEQNAKNAMQHFPDVDHQFCSFQYYPDTPNRPDLL